MQSDLSPNPIALIGAQTVALEPTILRTNVGQLPSQEVPRKREGRTKRMEAAAPLRRVAHDAYSWCHRYRKRAGLMALLASPVLLGFAGQQYFLHRQTAAVPADVRPIASRTSPQVEVSARAIVEPASASKGPVVSGAVEPAHASSRAEGGADGQLSASQVHATPSNPTPIYEPAKLPPAPPTPAATTPPMNLPPAVNAAAAVPLPAPLQNAAKGRAMQTTPSGEDPAGVKVTLKVTPVGLSKAAPQKAGDATPATQHETAASAATEVARPQVQPSTTQPS